MAKIGNLINESIKDRLVEVTSKPKRRRMRPQIVASTEEHRNNLLREIRAMDKRSQERGELPEPLVAVLFMWGKPQKRLSKTQVSVYKEMGARIEYLSETEVKSLNL
jgi:hypothetical protein